MRRKIKAFEKKFIFLKIFRKMREKRLTKQKFFSMINRLFANAERAERIWVKRIVCERIASISRGGAAR